MVAALAGWHEQHDAAADALAGVSALPAHVAVEAYSVLTRLPGGLAVPPAAAAAALARRFPDAPLALSGEQRGRLISDLATAGVLGGAAHDGLVALEAAAHGRMLLTLDARAETTYRRLGIAFRTVTG